MQCISDSSVEFARKGAISSTDQLAPPHAVQEGFELRELRFSQFRTPFTFDLLQNAEDFRISSSSTLRETDNARTARIRRIGPDNVSKIFHASKQLVHRLLAHAGAVGQGAGTNAIGARILQHRDVGEAQFIESGRIEFVNDAAMNGLRRNAQKSANQDIDFSSI